MDMDKAQRKSVYESMEKLEWYLLKYRKPVKTKPEKWIGQLEDFKTRRVRVKYWGDRLMVSTVFLGHPMGVGGDGKPLLFETMLVQLREHKNRWEIIGRATSWRGALKLHQQAVSYAKGLL